MMVIGDGTERARLDELAGLLGISRQIVFTGKIENTQVRHYLNAADAFLFTSKSETQGIVLLEAMAAGCPVTAVRASGVVDVVRQGVNGFMTAEDPYAFAAAAARLVLNQDVWSRMSDEARRTAQSYESGRIAALAAEQYGFMIRQKKDAGYGEHGKRMFVPSIAVRVSSYIFAYNPRVAAQGKKSPCITVACRGALPFLPGLIIRFPCVSESQGLSSR